MCDLTYNVYDNPFRIEDEDSKVLYDLVVLRSNIVAWVNQANQKLAITFDGGTATNTVFDERSIPIEVGGSEEITVKSDATGSTIYNITAPESTLPFQRPLPKVIVGDG